MAGTWKEWTLSDWNQRLLAAVFGCESSTSRPLRAIDVTPSFMAFVVGEAPSNGDEVRAAFLAAFELAPAQARKLFEADAHVPHGGLSPGEAPSFFVQLYLSCIAASATEETHQDGNFRHRLAAHLGLAEDHDYLSRGGLPKLWQELARWSIQCSKLGLQVRPLVLPDPAHETIIGYSKRLAFPSYRDQTRLARIIADTQVSENSPIHLIEGVVGSAIGDFGERFRSEYNRFRRAVADPSGDPAGTPFWSAFSALTWESSRGVVESRPALKIVVALDERSATGDILVESAGFPAPHGWNLVELDYEREGCSARVEAVDGEPINLVLEDPLSTLVDLRAGPLEKLVSEGCLPLCRGETVPWVHAQTIPRAGDCCLLLREDLFREARATIEGFRAIPLEGVQGWVVSEPMRSGYLRSSLGQWSPFSRMLAFRELVSPASIRLQDSIALPGGHLFLWPHLPAVAAPGASEIEVFRLNDHAPSDSVNPIGELEEEQDGRWVFPRDVAVAVDPPARVSLFARGGDGPLGRAVFAFTGACTSPRQFLDLGAAGFAREGARGHLLPVARGGDSSSAEIELTQVAESRFAETVASRLSERADPPGVLPSVQEPRWVPLQELPTEWAEVLEVTIALTSRRLRGMNWQELKSVVRRGLPSLVPELAVEALVQNGLVRRYFSLRSTAVSYFANPPRAALLSDTKGEGRVVGALGKIQRAELIRRATPQGIRAEVAVLGPFVALGVVRLLGVDESTLHALCRDVGITVIDQPASPQVPPPREVLACVSRRVRLNEDPRERKPWNLGPAALERYHMETRRFEGEPNSYVICHDNTAVWGTQSLAWARLIAAALLQGRRVRKLDARRALLPRPGPEVFGQGVLWMGDGVIGPLASESEDSLWLYSYRDRSQADDGVGAWMSRRHEVDSAMKRWVSSSTRLDVKETAVLRERYLRVS